MIVEGPGCDSDACDDEDEEEAEAASRFSRNFRNTSLALRRASFC